MTRKRPHRAELLARNAQITSIKPSVSMHAQHLRGEEPYIESGAWLELRGTLEEPVGGVQHVELSLYPRDQIQVGTARPAAVGAIIGARPTLTVVVAFPRRDFSSLWALALAGQLTCASLVFAKPRYNRGLVVSVSFSTVREE